jgi:hypothetical protein
LYQRFAAMEKPPRHPKWHEVNLAASVPGWTRFLAADEQIKDRFFHDEEQKLPGLGAHPTWAMMDRLWRDYVLWRDAALGPIKNPRVQCP